MSLTNKLHSSSAVAGIRMDAPESQSFAGTAPVTATPTATVVPAIQIASAVVTAAGVGAAVGHAID